MNEATEVVETLAAAYPRHFAKTETRLLYVGMLASHDAGPAQAAAVWWIRRERFAPSVSDLLEGISIEARKQSATPVGSRVELAPAPEPSFTPEFKDRAMAAMKRLRTATGARQMPTVARSRADGTLELSKAEQELVNQRMRAADQALAQIREGGTA